MSVNPISTGMLRELSKYGDSPLVRELASTLTAAQEENERLVHDIERLSASLAAEVSGSEMLREASFCLRNAQRAYMEDRGNDEKGRAVGMAAAALDAALDGLPR